MYKITNYIETELAAGNTVNNKQIRKICEQNGIDIDNHTGAVKEAVEIGLMHVARDIAQHSNYTTRQKYDRLIDLYNRQPYVGTVRTLNQMIKQQYSTPLPIAFLMSEFVKSKSNEALYFEPSAGNGFLTVALPQRDTICNEIDKFRLDNLCNEHYRKVTNQDGRKKFEYGRIFDGVVTNPPFIKEIDTMIFNALDCMKDNGRCAILRDGNNMFQDYYGTKHRSKFVGFYDRLLAEYNVVKIININSKKIYAKQGTAFFMHIILIDGRRSTPNDTPKNRVFNPEIDKTELAGFEELWEYFSPYFIDETSYYYYSLANKSKLLFKELELTIEVGDEFVKEKQLSWKQKSKIYNWLRSKEIKDKEIFDFYYVSHINKNGDIYLFNEQSNTTHIYTRQEFYELGLQFYKHYKSKGLGSLDPDFVIEYHCNGEIYYDLSEARKYGNKITASIAETMIPSVSVTQKDDLKSIVKKLLSSEFEYVWHGLMNQQNGNIKKGDSYRVIFTKYSYICNVDINGNIEIIRRYDTEGETGIGGIYAANIKRPRLKREFGYHRNIQGQRLYATKISQYNIQGKATDRINVAQNHNTAIQGTRPTQIAGLDGLSVEQWQNFLAEKEDWRYFQIRYSETKYHSNAITVRKPYIVNRGGENGYIQYWFHCRKNEIDEKIKVIDKVFNVIINKFTDEWKTKNPIISYKATKDSLNKEYYIVKRELRFTPKESEKFLQVIPFFLKMLTATPDELNFQTEENSFFYPNLKYCKFQTVAEKVSELAIKEMDLLKLISLDERIRLNFSDAPEKVVKNLISNSWIIATQDEIRKHLQAINIKDVMWDLLANGNYTEETENYIITKGKDPKDKRMPKWVNIIYSYLCDKYGVKQRIE